MRLAVAPCCCPCAAPSVLAARSVARIAPITVKLETSQPGGALPEPVASVSVGLAPERMSLDYDGPISFCSRLIPRSPGVCLWWASRDTLVCRDVQDRTPADDVVHVTATPAGAAAHAPPVSVATLLRALRTGTVVPGQQAVDLPPPVLPDTRVRVTGSSALAVGTTLGLVLTLRNSQQTPLTLDLRLGAPVAPPARA